MFKVALLVYDNCLQSGVAGILDLLTLANWQQKLLNPDRTEPFCRVTVVSDDGTPVTSFNRQPVVPAEAIDSSAEIDLLVVPGIMGRPEMLTEQSAAAIWIAHRHAEGTVVASACSGAFLLARSGVVGRRPLTTHWQLADRFRRHFPRTQLRIEEILIDGGDYISAGGTGAHFDLALYLIEKYASSELARACARMMLIDDRRRDQAPFVRFQGYRGHDDEPILRVQQWLDRYYREKVSVRVMAKRAGLHERTFLRRFRKATGEAPLEYLQKLRIEEAKRLLRSGQTNLAAMTGQIGYQDVSSFRRLFVQHVGMSPTVYRQRFFEPEE